MLTLPKYSVGVGDRFARQAKAQLEACRLAQQHGVEVAPVWNKSNREHLIVGSEPASVRDAADAAVAALGWRGPYFVDADHIRLDTVDRFIASSDFFTIDVADSIGQPAASDAVASFVERHSELAGEIALSGVDAAVSLTRERIEWIAQKYLLAAQEAGAIYRHIEGRLGRGRFVTEVSMDETDAPQTPSELLVILAAIADEGIPIQTIAPKFTGRFNKGVDYVGDVAQFAREFTADIAVIRKAVVLYGLPANLKLSVHSGSDKFSLYTPIHEALVTLDAGVHLKTAGTTWLEEIIGLAESGGDGLALAKAIYREACGHLDALCAPYAAVIDIDRSALPAPDEVACWSAEQMAATVRHDPSCAAFNASVRQLLHVGYKVAAQMGDRYLSLVEANEPVIAHNVTANLFDRHIRPVFIGD